MYLCICNALRPLTTYELELAGKCNLDVRAVIQIVLEFWGQLRPTGVFPFRAGGEKCPVEVVLEYVVVGVT